MDRCARDCVASELCISLDNATRNSELNSEVMLSALTLLPTRSKTFPLMDENYHASIGKKKRVGSFEPNPVN
ncbi:hypothetical protein J6590_016156 [Homalodisca vitripennis]|nr:hypothetical protein J6590_016156 [Homalodisca vitripennis]